MLNENETCQTWRRYVLTIAHRFTRSHAREFPQEIESAALRGLFKAVRDYDPKRGACLKTCIVVYVRRYMQNELRFWIGDRGSTRRRRRPCLESQLSWGEGNPRGLDGLPGPHRAEDFWQDTLHELHLAPPERLLLELRFREGMSWAAVGERIGVTGRAAAMRFQAIKAEILARPTKKRPRGHAKKRPRGYARGYVKPERCIHKEKLP